jgi:hypothetical protein
MLAGAATGAIALAAAFAQTPEGSGDEESAEAPASAVITPRRSESAPPGPVPEKAAPAIDWAKVREQIAETRKRDEAFDRQLRAMSQSRDVPAEERERLRPKGLRSIAPGQLQSKSVTAAEVARTRVPLLVPLTSDTVGALRVVARENAYTAFGDLPNGASFELAGTCMRVVGGPPEVVRMRMAQRKEFAAARIDGLDAPFVISRHEQGVDLSFSKFNCGYMITVYCDKPDADARCAEDDFVTGLASNTAILNESEGATP